MMEEGGRRGVCLARRGGESRRDGLSLRARERSEHGRARSFLLPFLPFYNRKNCIYSMKHAARHAHAPCASAECGGTAQHAERVGGSLPGRMKNKGSKDSGI